MEIHLPSVPMMKILSYLDAFSLLQVAQVNKSWNTVASSDVLWRKFCQKRWLFCDKVNLQFLGTETWKQFYVYRTWQEHTKSRAKPEDFTYKEIPAEYGVRAYACYISGCGLTRNRNDKSIVCMVTSVNRISTWDIHEGVMTWESPGHPAVIMRLTTLPEMHMAVTVDIESTIKLWDYQNREALATNNLSSPCQLLKAVDTKDGPIVLAGDTLGNLYVFRIPDLHLISRVNVFPYSIDEIYCSPQKKWVFLNQKHPQILPKVFYMSSLLRTSEFSAPVSTNLDFSCCERAFWTPRREDRITMMSRSAPPINTKFVTFDMKLEKIGTETIAKGHLIARFSLKDYKERPEWMGVSDKYMIVCSTLSCLLLFSMNGFRLQTFQYGPEEIVSLWVDPVHVIVTLYDGSLDVYAWKERTPLLRRCYRLQNRKCLPPQSLIFRTLCDDVSIIRVMRNSPAPCFLMAYTLKADFEN
ncbi:F-box/WD repeat-containing protein 15-like isoform X2 [Apodemus sylvaticus]|uniref:F-box/WD repeat-containing protein 15-like isoform X2 n=1 Tax=Apodemus sylvaticus TaxID=10129 RepID=UPI002243DFDC|nr:F-box/WD repeat-containing protein 15-like isoform X2 [Apodemus sylvaticus]